MKQKNLLSICMVLVLLFSMSMACGLTDEVPTQVNNSGSTDQPQATATRAAPKATATAGNAGSSGEQGSTGSSGASSDTWLVMLYQDADDEILEKDIFIDLNEAEMVGS